MYKKNFKNLVVGQKVKLKVIETHPNWIIVSFGGDLMRVSNKTQKEFFLNEEILLLVKKVSPIEFALPSGKGFSVWV